MGKNSIAGTHVNTIPHNLTSQLVYELAVKKYMYVKYPNKPSQILPIPYVDITVGSVTVSTRKGFTTKNIKKWNFVTFGT